MPGSWIPLMLSMSIFTSKFSIGMMSSIMPHLNRSLLFLGLELFSTIIFGNFAGRGVNCLIRYRASSKKLPIVPVSTSSWDNRTFHLDRNSLLFNHSHLISWQWAIGTKKNFRSLNFPIEIIYLKSDIWIFECSWVY